MSQRKRPVNSLVWTDEETRYLKAVLKWKENDARSDDENGPGGRRLARRENNTDEKILQQRPAGEFRILVVGAKGTGKTSILTRFATGTVPGEGEPPDPFYERGCRHRIELDSSLSFPGQITVHSPSHASHPRPTAAPQPSPRQKTQTYVVDALEMPSKHLPSNPMLEQALNITEAGVLVYDVRDPKSLQLVLGIAEFVREYLDKVNSSSSQTQQVNNNNSSSNNKYQPHHRPQRQYPLILVGNKSDVDDDNERAVSWSEGSKAASRITSILSPNNTNNNPQSISSSAPCPFVEASAKTGDNVDVIFPRLARDILRNKWFYQQQQRRQRELALAEQEGQGQGQGRLQGKDSSYYSSSGGSGGVNDNKRRRGIWRTLTAPCFCGAA